MKDFLMNNWQTILLILVGVYEVIIRYYPTVKNYSIISMLVEIIKFLVPNQISPTRNTPFTRAESGLSIKGKTRRFIN